MCIQTPASKQLAFRHVKVKVKILRAGSKRGLGIANAHSQPFPTTHTGTHAHTRTRIHTLLHTNSRAHKFSLSQAGTQAVSFIMVGQDRIYAPYMTIYDRMYGDFPAKNTVCTPYIRIIIWFWPTLSFHHSPAGL
jgi:hypothetical protein